MMNRITESLWIGDIGDVRGGDTSRFDRVISVCQDSAADNVGCPYEHFDMADGDETGLIPGDASYDLFADAVDAVRDALSNDEVVLVHCHVGQSRSAAVCIATIAVERGINYWDAYSVVSDARMIHPSSGVVDHARQYIDQ